MWPRGTHIWAPEWLRVVEEVQLLLPRAWTVAWAAGKASRGYEQGQEPLG